MNYPQAGKLHRRAGRQAAPQDWPVGCTLRGASGLHIKLGCGKGRSGGLPFSAARPALFCSPPHRLFVQPAGPPFYLVFCAARQPTDSSRFSFGNMALQPTWPAAPPISVIRYANGFWFDSHLADYLFFFTFFQTCVLPSGIVLGLGYGYLSIRLRIG